MPYTTRTQSHVVFLFKAEYYYETASGGGRGGAGVTIRASIIGVSGYGGGELARLLVGHPQVRLVHLAAGSRAGGAMSGLYPNLRGFTDAVTETADAEAIAPDSDVVFLAPPNGEAMNPAPPVVAPTRLVALGPAFCFTQPRD